jgi:hypothetical protein
MKPAPLAVRILLIVLTLAIGIASVSFVSGATVVKDAAQELQMAINIRHHGIMSMEEAPPYPPTMYREPLPSVLEAGGVAVGDWLLGSADPEHYFSGERIMIVKYVNVICLLLLWGVTIAAARWLSASYVLAILAGLAAIKPFFSPTSDIGVNTLNTELLAALLLTAASFTLLLAQTRCKLWQFAISGICFGLMALTKASMLYAFAGVLLILIIGNAARITLLKTRFAHLLVLAAAFALVVVPWIGRNMYEFRAPEISLRGGLAIYTRALMDGMTAVEYRGSFYVWAKPGMQPYVARLLGFQPADLQMGGRLERLNADPDTAFYAADLAAERAGRPADARTYYRRARAERTRLDMQVHRDGSDPDVAEDNAMKSEGLALIRHEPWAHAALVVPLIWRSGHWYLAALVLAFAYACWARQRDLVQFVLPGLTLLAFYALATPYEPRWSAVVNAVAISAVVTLIRRLLPRLPSRWQPFLRESAPRSAG